MANTRGFTAEEQVKLEKLVKFAQRAAAIVTDIYAPSMDEDEIVTTLKDIAEFAQKSWPNGPLQLQAELNEVSTFCDLTIITKATDTKGKIL